MLTFGIIPLSSYKMAVKVQLHGEKRSKVRGRAKPLTRFSLVQCWNNHSNASYNIFLSSCTELSPFSLSVLDIVHGSAFQPDDKPRSQSVYQTSIRQEPKTEESTGRII